MSKKANTALIGLFVIGAITLGIISLIVLGAGKIFSEKSTYVTYFDSSVQGLRPGANVTFRGVRIGQVNTVYVRFDESMLEFVLPVIIEFQEGAIQTISDEDNKRSDLEIMEALIERGLRAKLQMESFVTGQLPVFHQPADWIVHLCSLHRHQNPNQNIGALRTAIWLDPLYRAAW